MRGRTGAWGWGLTLATVLAYDAWAVLCGYETMSSAYRRAMTHPGRRRKVAGLSGYLVLHLYAPPALRRFDPLSRLAAIVEVKPKP